MASVQECEAAIERLSQTLGGREQASGLDRSLSFRATDLDVTWTGRLHDGRLDDLTREDRPRAQIRLAATSDDLVALTSGSLGFAGAWASGRLKVDAGVMDLLKLRSLL
ncbi:SCP2 sterol-binding domain-containing protein [Vallicoccus soli]|uniref:Sterol-binding protein n=1 Tax=Vallicoccus soli TaxID=2339232 RepID=A0A3A3YTJ8_9ACTN|nr:SCP2 sterol-binding domain-containing protein [Vallicoccus soli]RJK93109.1 sterol-binding protein [Vallicoccus soli]